MTDNKRLDAIKARLAKQQPWKYDAPMDILWLVFRAPDDIKWLIDKVTNLKAECAYLTGKVDGLTTIQREMREEHTEVCEELRKTSIELEMWVTGDKTND